VPAIGIGSPGDPTSRDVRLSVRAAASQLSLTVVFRMKRGAVTVTGILTSLQPGVTRWGNAEAAIAKPKVNR
jgi:hypothetical protein